MKIALIHNPEAFRAEADGNHARRIFERAGHHVTYVSTMESNWQRAISPEIARAIIMGGDGTVQLAAPHLRGTPFSILPSGTANNIAHCLRQTADIELLAAQLEQAEVCRLDLGKASSGLERKAFLETTGLGVFAELILAMQHWPQNAKMERAESREEKFAHALKQLQAISREYQGIAVQLKADHQAIRDRFLLLAVMNMELIGPRLPLAPQADPGDGFLDLVYVRVTDRDNLCRWLEGQSSGRNDGAPFERRRCRRIEIGAPNDALLHIDSYLMQKPEFPVIFEIEPGALEYSVTAAKAGSHSS
jgi:diacylglycerol kinase (ATP)